MIHTAKLSQGLSRIRNQFLARLFDRRKQILWNTLKAGEASDPAEAHKHLTAVRDILHQIAGTAATLGFAEFGSSARQIENDIDVFLLGSEGSFASADLLRDLVHFSETANDIITAG
jgi:hypothetical protein